MIMIKLNFKMIVLLLSIIMKLEAITGSERPMDINKEFDNWTTCKEFLNGSIFDEKRLLDVDWRVFYLWATEYEDPYTVRFRLPTKMDVDRFKETIETRVNQTDRPSNVQWNEPAFFMESTIDLSALYFRTETPGQYQVVSSLIFQYIIEPEVIFGMKMVEPGYFAFMNCAFKVGAAFAPNDMMPKDNELLAAANLFKVRNPLGFPHNVADNLPDIPHVVESNDDVDDEEEMEVQMDGTSILD